MKFTLARQNVSEFFVPWPLADGDNDKAMWIALLMKSTLSEIDLGKTKCLRIFRSMAFGWWRPLNCIVNEIDVEWNWPWQEKMSPNFSFYGLWLMETLWIALLMKSTLSGIDLGRTKCLRIFRSMDFGWWRQWQGHVDCIVNEIDVKWNWPWQDKKSPNFRWPCQLQWIVSLWGFASSTKSIRIFRSVDFEGWCTLLNHASRSVEESIAKCDWLLQNKIFSNLRVQGHRLMRMIAWPCQLQWLFPYGDLLLAQKVYEFFIPWNLHVNTCALAMCACNDKSTQSPHKIS